MKQNRVKTQNLIIAAADQCVKCGLCLPHCPTYRLLRNEADSPRGRIALMQGLAQGRLEADSGLLSHLDRCLGCQACEKVCPSEVHYGQLMDCSRDLLTTRRPWLARLKRTAALYLLSRPTLWRRGWRLLQLYQRSGMQTLLRYSGLLRLLGLQRLDALLPDIKSPPTAAATAATGIIEPAAQPSLRHRVGLLAGCMEDIVSDSLRQDAIRLLDHAGYTVQTPERLGCCGALHQHNGAITMARSLAQKNSDAFKRAGLDTVLYLSSGCGVTLKDYPSLTLPAHPGNNTPDIEFVEAIQFLWNTAALRPEHFNPLATSVAWLSPCSQRHVTGGQKASRQLLDCIPDITVIDLNNDCCGAAGSYMLTQPALATSLRDEVLESLRHHAVSHLLTANVGCALHLGNGLRQRGLEIEVLHPLTLLARQLKTGLRTWDLEKITP